MLCGAGSPRDSSVCGFVAIVSSAGLTTVDLERMRDRLAHRGPDGKGAWIGATRAGATVALGHRRLSIIDLSDAALQPMRDPQTGAQVVYNGEIYNYRELRTELAAFGETFRTQSDTEVLLACYRRWGEACLGKLNGMFAFALWDERAQRLFVARDRFGEKPCFHARLPDGGTVVASEMKAILAHPAFVARPHDAHVFAFSKGMTDPRSDETFFHGVRRLMPANAMRVAADGSIEAQWRFWTPDYTAVLDASDEKGHADTFRSLLENSVKQRLETSDVRVGACLSGGLDSSVMVGVLSRTTQAREGAFRNTISARFDDDPTVSEGTYIDAVLEGSGLEGSAVTPTAEGLMEESRCLHWHQEEPFLSASIYLEWCVQRRARELGCKVMIDGQGSDELLGGYQGYFPIYQRDLLRRGELSELWRNTTLFNARMAAEARKYVDSRRRFNASVGMDWRQLMGSAIYGRDAALPQAPGVPDGRPDQTFRHQLAYGMLYSSLPVQLHSADRSAMAFGVETRFPFLDHHLVDWATGLPDRLLVRQGWQKYILRRASAGLIPERVRWRVDKVGFAAPQDRWLRKSAVRDWVEDRLFSGPATALESYDRAVLHAAWRAHVAAHADHSWLLWRWISLNEWLSLFDTGTWGRALGAAPARDTAALGSEA
jgi:asparagine synthase (glutamine-hydrolysing)